ncbi:hypothetical protein EJ110_NYTH45650 [Nymphaea thermarum]|nr:hypothetical protein EJ110_NYTH45650 [Nymphaea thermarum]
MATLPPPPPLRPPSGAWVGGPSLCGIRPGNPLPLNRLLCRAAIGFLCSPEGVRQAWTLSFSWQSTIFNCVFTGSLQLRDARGLLQAFLPPAGCCFLLLQMGDCSLRPRLPKVVSVGRPAPSPWRVPSSRRASRLRHLLQSVASIRVRWGQWWCQRCASLNGHRAVTCSRCCFLACQNDHRLFARRHGFAVVTSSFWVQVPLPVVQRPPSSDESSMYFGSIRLPWPGPACPGTRGPPFSVQVPQVFSPGDPSHQCSSVVELPPSQLPPLLPSPRAPASPQRKSLACSLPRSPEVPCLPFPFPALRAGAPRESTSKGPDPLLVAAQSDLGDVQSSAPSPSAARPSAGGCPLEVAVVARSRSTAACVVLASGASASPVSRSPSVVYTLLFTLFASTSAPPSSPVLLSGPTTRPVGRHSLFDGLPPVAPLLDAELGISLPDALDALKVSLPPEQLDLLRSSFVAAVAPVSRSSLARLRRELHRIGASATSILVPPGRLDVRRFTWFPHEGCMLECAGLSARYRRRYLSSWIRQHGPSVLIVVETKMSVISHACVRTLLRQPSFGFLSARGAAGGILLAWSPPLTGAVVHVGRYSISASLSRFWPNGLVLVTAVYGPCVGALRGQLWAELHQVRQLAASPWLLAGDFNCLLSPADSSSPVTSGPSMSVFRSFVDEFGLFDVPSTNGTFTWSNNRNPPILCRLNRIFLSPELFSAFPSSSLVLGPRHLSDHAPLLLTLLRGRAGIGHARFRFELWRLRDESFVATVPNWWAPAVNGRWATFRLSWKLHSIRREVLAWKRIFWSSKFLKVADWDEDILSLQAFDNISADQSSRLLCLQCLA